MAAKRADLFRNLSTMLQAGIPIERAFHVTTKSASGRLRAGFRHIGEQIHVGRSVGDAMAEKHRAFTPFEIAVVSVGDQSGNLPETLRTLANWQEFTDTIRRSIRAKLAIPVLMFHVACLVFQGFFYIRGTLSQAIHGEGEVITGLAFAVGLAKMLSLFYVPALAIFAVYHFTPRSGPIRAAFDGIWLHVPILGKAMQELALSRYCDSFYMLTKAGVPIHVAADQAADMATNVVIGRRLRGAAVSASNGLPLHEGFSRWLPKMFRDTFEVGEETGTLDRTLEALARQYRESAEFYLNELGKWAPKLVYFLIVLLVVWMIFTLGAEIAKQYSQALN